jgi:hypothetical protein
MANSRYTGTLPTIADTKRLGMTSFRVECSTRYCHHEKLVEFDALGLPEETVFLDIPKLRRFICEKCGGREATVGADWNGYYAALNKRRAERLSGQNNGGV